MSSSNSSIKAIFRQTFKRTFSFIRWICFLLFILYFLSGTYSISSNQIGILQRFGKVVEDKIQPGIHYGFPWPIDRVSRVPVKIIKRIQVDDFYTANSYCITGDNNLINIQCTIQYTIIHPFNYLFRVVNAEVMLDNITNNTIIKCLSSMPIDHAMTIGKQAIAANIKLNLQTRLDVVQSGLGISFVELRDIKPPAQVRRFFSDVVKAKIDRKNLINKAETYHNKEVPRAKADTTMMIEQSQAYKTQVVLEAEGVTARFLKQVEQKGQFAKNMIYINTLREILQKVGKKHIIMTNKGEKPVKLKLFNKK